ncbi:MAG TPA: enoyl-CoA hydratase/isomerase family protein [Streptosporangiaceae bacterium]|nr:enoyl-CoA hydratase/isomerase family protein [Streptosporangiaceae bacterium]
MTAFTEITYQRRGPAAWITLNRPARRNALTPTMLAEAHRALDQAEAETEAEAGDPTRVLVLTGAPPAFCAGADLSFFLSLLDEPDGCDRFLAELIHPLARLMARLRASARPVVAAVNGACAAGGLELILACDLIVADQTATFTDAHSRLGIAPAVGAAAGLARAVGEIRAKQILLLSEPVTAAAMATYGLVTEVTAPGRLDQRVTDLAATLSHRSPVSFAAMKTMVHQAQQPSWEQSLESDLAFFRRNWNSAALREGLDAYATRRAPSFAPPSGPSARTTPASTATHPRRLTPGGPGGR